MKLSVGYVGWITVEAKSREEAQEIYENWVGDIQDRTHYDYHGTILEAPFFAFDGIDEED